MLFKVLGADGEPLHGGTGRWPLPHDGHPGEWLHVNDPRCCVRGLHLTSDPLRWWCRGARLFEAQTKAVAKIHGDGSDKAAFEWARLLSEITRDWPLAIMYPRVRAFLAASERSRDVNADLSWANLVGADLSRVNLSRANLTRADLSRANLAGANRDKVDDPAKDWTLGDDGRLSAAR